MADLTFGGTDIHDPLGIFFDLVAGFDGVAEVRGRDLTIPGRPGQHPLSRVKHRRLPELRGYIMGTGATPTLQEQDYAANVITFQTLFNPTDAAKALVVAAPYLGLVAGTKTITARYLNTIWDQVVDVTDTIRFLSVQLEAVGNPPDWA